MRTFITLSNTSTKDARLGSAFVKGEATLDESTLNNRPVKYEATCETCGAENHIRKQLLLAGATCPSCKTHWQPWPKTTQHAAKLAGRSALHSMHTAFIFGDAVWLIKGHPSRAVHKLPPDAHKTWVESGSRFAVGSGITDSPWAVLTVPTNASEFFVRMMPEPVPPPSIPDVPMPKLKMETYNPAKLEYDPAPIPITPAPPLVSREQVQALEANKEVEFYMANVEDLPEGLEFLQTPRSTEWRLVPSTAINKYKDNQRSVACLNPLYFFVYSQGIDHETYPD